MISGSGRSPGEGTSYPLQYSVYSPWGHKESDWRIAWLVGCSPWGHEESDTTERLHFPFLLSCTGEGNGNPLQCSCLENPRDGGAWWAAIYGVAQSRTRLKQLIGGSSNCVCRCLEIKGRFRILELIIFTCMVIMKVLVGLPWIHSFNVTMSLWP